MIKEWIASALHVSKSIRHKRAWLRRLEIEDLCAEYLRSNVKKTAGMRAMVVGTGASHGLIRGILALTMISSATGAIKHNKPEIPDA